MVAPIHSVHCCPTRIIKSLQWLLPLTLRKILKYFTWLNIYISGPVAQIANVPAKFILPYFIQTAKLHFQASSAVDMIMWLHVTKFSSSEFQSKWCVLLLGLAHKHLLCFSVLYYMTLVGGRAIRWNSQCWPVFLERMDKELSHWARNILYFFLILTWGHT